jgi:hypothetical protein
VNTFRVWNPFTQSNVPFDRNTRWNPYLTVVVSKDDKHWSMAKREDLIEIETGLNNPKTE